MAFASSYVQIQWITTCTDDGCSEGNNDLAVKVISFVSRVVCSEQRHPYDIAVLGACEDALDHMETSKQERLFTQAAIHDPNLEVSLPAYYIAPAEGTTAPPLP